MAKITFEQSGGFVGVTRRTVLDLADLPEALRPAAEWMASISPKASSVRGRDLTRFCLEINDGEIHRTLRFDDQTLPPELAALIEHLAKRSRPVPPVA